MNLKSLKNKIIIGSWSWSGMYKNISNKSIYKKQKRMSNNSNKRLSTKQQSEPQAKLRLLMLHGYRQNEMAFRERSGGFRKALKNLCSKEGII